MRNIEQEHLAGATLTELSDKWGITDKEIAAILEHRSVVRRLSRMKQREAEQEAVTIRWVSDLYL